jgi:phage-related minor tail protein
MSTPPAAPIQFGVQAAESPAIESAAETLNTAVESAEQAAEHQVENAETEVETAEETATVATAAVHTHETILTNLFTDLEGFQNMAKSEIYSVVQRWNGEFKKL